ncbi:MAG: hypothetical protein WC788_08210 [Candidatus Paceibacterota bacterium]|jgi:hypothetical protein
MEKNRYFNTKFWSDSYILNLDPSEKLLYIYLFTNSHTNICGIYEIALKIIAFETGFDKDMVERILKRFEDDGKIFYIENRIIVKNFIKHQKLHPNMILGIKKELANIPKEIMAKIKENTVLKQSHIEDIGRLSKPFKDMPLSESESESELESKSKKKESRFAPPSFEEVKKYCEERKNTVSPQSFIDFYESKGWFVGKNKMKSWKAAVRTWESRSSPPAENFELIKRKT